MKRRVSARSDGGVAAVELALVLPVFLALVLAGIDFALAFRQQVMLRNAASDAATYAAVQPCDLTGSTGITFRATNEVQGETALKPGNISVPVKYLDASGNVLSGSTACTTAYQVQVAVSAPYQLLTGTFLGMFGVPSSMSVSGQETVRIQGR